MRTYSTEACSSRLARFGMHVGYACKMMRNRGHEKMKERIAIVEHSFGKIRRAINEVYTPPKGK